MDREIILRAKELGTRVQQGISIGGNSGFCFRNIVTPEVLKRVIRNAYNTRISILNTDIVTASLSEIRYGNSICILNSLGYSYANGMLVSGDFNQDSQLCFCTNLYDALVSSHNMYLSDFDRVVQEVFGGKVLLTRGITFVRDSRLINLPADDYRCDILTCVPIHFGAILDYETESIDSAKLYMYRRLSNILKVLSNYDYDTIVIGEYGLGIFRNDSDWIANSFRLLLKSPYRGTFKKVVFAIYDDTEYKTYRDILSKI